MIAEDSDLGDGASVQVFYYKVSGEGWYRERPPVGTPTTTATNRWETFDCVHSTLVPTSTNTLIPSPTLVSSLTPTPVRDFQHLADCRTPVYHHPQPAVSLGVSPTTSEACYRVVPQIDVDSTTIFVVHIHIVPVDVCFDFFTPTLVLMGITIDIPGVVGILAVLFLAYWGLFSA